MNMDVYRFLGRVLSPPGLAPPPPCAICGRDDARFQARLSGVCIYQCLGCNFVFGHPLLRVPAPSSGHHSIMTPETYMDAIRTERSEHQRQYDGLALARFHEYASVLGREPFSILEVGCGAANFAWTFERLGARYHGIDIDQEAIQAAQRSGLKNVRCIDLFDLPGEERYDVICASQVLEHMIRPVDFIERISGLLNEGGVIHLDVPNHRSLSGLVHEALPLSSMRFGGIHLPHHLFAYDETAMARLLQARFRARTFSVNPDHPLWGQVGAFRFRHRAFYELCDVFAGKCMVIGFGTKR